MNDITHAAKQMRTQLASVARLRKNAVAQGLDDAVRAVKRIQSLRFRAS